jgi:nicotinate-nucleotide adenylyltransferase
MTAAGASVPPQGSTGPIGVFGGTFDPVHHGHLRAALEVMDHCRLAGMLLVPSGAPPHRAPPVASADLRVRMLRAAVAGEPRLTVDDREIRRPGPSYMVDTLASLRSELGSRPLCLVLGADAFQGLPSWQRWREITGLAHVIVIPRPGCALPVAGELADLVSARRCEDVMALHRASTGFILAHTVTRLEISSSAIRSLVAAGGDARFLVPDAVRDIVTRSGCYLRPAGTAAGSTEAQLRA